jgi:FkbM family methyltransferase
MSGSSAPATSDHVGRQSLADVVGFILRHPANRRRRLRSVVRFAAWQVWKRLTRRPVTVRFWRGLRVRVYPDSRSASLALYTGFPEYDDMTFTQRFVKPGDLVIDVGANIGLYTILAASRARDGRVIAIEPHPIAADRLARNVRMNSLTNVDVHVAAAGAHRGEARLTADLDTVNHIVTSTETARSITVPVVPLDHIVAPGSKVALVKLDAEGFEAEVLAGARRLLAEQAVSVWIVEVNGLGARYGSGDRSVIETLQRAGYEPYRYTADTNTLDGSEPPTGEAEWNLIFIADVAEVRARLG